MDHQREVTNSEMVNACENAEAFEIHGQEYMTDVEMGEAYDIFEGLQNEDGDFVEFEDVNQSPQPENNQADDGNNERSVQQADDLVESVINENNQQGNLHPEAEILEDDVQPNRGRSTKRTVPTSRKRERSIIEREPYPDEQPGPSHQAYNDERVKRYKKDRAAEIMMHQYEAKLDNNTRPTADQHGAGRVSRVNIDFVNAAYHSFTGEAKCWTCPECIISFARRELLDEHMYEIHTDNNQVGMGDDGEELEGLEITSRTILQHIVLSRVDLSQHIFRNSDTLFLALNTRLSKLFDDQIKVFKKMKVFFNIQCLFQNDKDEEPVVKWFNSFAHTLLHSSNIPNLLQLARDKVGSEIENYLERGSGLTLIEIPKFEIKMAKYNPIRGGTYMELPWLIKYRNEKKKCIVNIDNSEEQYTKDLATNPKNCNESDKLACFKWSILMAIKDYTENKKDLSDMERLRKVDKAGSRYRKANFDGLQYPVTLNQIALFEKNNPHLSINVFTHEYTKKGCGWFFKSTDEKDEVQTVDDNPRLPTETQQEYFDRLSTLLGRTITYRDFMVGHERTSKINETIKKYTAPVYLSKNTGNTKEINLLLLMQDFGKEHFTWAKDLVGFLGLRYIGNGHLCMRCLNGFSSKANLDYHQERCAQLKAQVTRFPEKGTHLEFGDYKNMNPSVFRIYADFESFIQGNPDCKADTSKKISDPRYYLFERAKTKGMTEYDKIHKVCGYSYVCLDYDGNVRDRKVYHSEDDSEDVISTFFNDIIPYHDTLVKKINQKQKEAPSTMIDERYQIKGEDCYFCDKTLPYIWEFDEDPEEQLKLQMSGEMPVRHHDHFTHKFLGYAHKDCNIRAKYTDFIPILFHNLSGYDGHPIMQGLNHPLIKEVDIIPLSSEKFISININKTLRFVDSMRFLNTSLDKLSSMLGKDDKDGFKATREVFKTYFGDKVSDMDEHMHLLYRKGFFPYNSITCKADLERTDIPSKEEFYSDLTGTDISEKDYEHVKTVWSTFKINNLGEYLDFYNLLDTTILADCFENFRGIFLDKFKLDPAKYVSLPSIAWQSALKYSKVKLDYITDPDMHLFLEDGLRGGYSGCGSVRHVESNNKYMPEGEYDPSKPSSYLMYWDCNALYATALSHHLPIKNFSWVSNQELKAFQNPDFIMGCQDDAPHGYVLECDLSTPPELHDKFDNFPPAPVKRKVVDSELSPYQKQLHDDLNMKGGSNSEKLILDLHPKKNYVIHYVTLKEYLKLGMKLEKVHKVLQFEQDAWLEPFITLCTNERQKATNSFEKDFWKLMVNSLFGKSIEQKRNRRKIKVVTTSNQVFCDWVTGDRVLNYTKRANLSDIVVVNDHTVLFIFKNTSVYLDKPIYTGIACLDISKTYMYKFYYDYLSPMYGTRLRLVGTDTDSLMVSIAASKDDMENGIEVDVYKDMLYNREIFDLSDYPTEGKFSFMHDPTNKKVRGKFKDETCEKGVITAFCFLKPKMYSYTTELSYDMRAEGIPKSYVKTNLRHIDYVNALTGNTDESKKTFIAKKITSKNHNLYNCTFTKKNISQYDDKRYYVNYNKSYAYGNVNITV